MAVINFPIPYINDPDTGKPLFEGQVFVGQPDLDPEVVGNQKQLNIVQENGTVIPIPQPAILSQGGIPQHNGTPVRLDVSGNYSIKILDKNGAQKYYIENVFEGHPVTVEGQIADLSQSYEFATVAEMEDSTIVFPAGKKLTTIDYRSTKSGGGASYVVTSGSSPNIGSPALTVGFYAKLQIENGVDIKQWGAFNDGATTKTDNTVILEACAAYCIANDVALTCEDGNFWCSGDVNLWGVRKIDLRCSLRSDVTTNKIIIGANTTSAQNADFYIFEAQGTIQVHGLNRGTLKFVAANTLWIYASDDVPNRHTVSYSNFEWVNIDNLRMGAVDTMGTVPWINECTFISGRIRSSILFDGTYPMNGHKFLAPTLESVVIDLEQGRNINFYNARLEGTLSGTWSANTFNVVLWNVWSNFSNTPMWDVQPGTNNIVDLGDNNRVAPVSYAYTEKDATLSIDRENLDNNGIFSVGTSDTQKIKVLRNAATFFDTGLMPSTDKLWFNVYSGSTSTASLLMFMSPYDADGDLITVEPSGYQASQGATSWNAAGYWEYTSGVNGGSMATNPNASGASGVAFVRVWARTTNGATGNEIPFLRCEVVQPQEDKYPVKNIAGDVLRIDTVSDHVTATSELTAIDLLRFTSGTTTQADAASSLAGTLEIALTAEKGSTEGSGMATIPVLISREDAGVITITAGTPVLLSGSGIQFTSVTIGTKAGATISEAIMTIQITTNQADPFDALNARARITGVSDFHVNGTYLIAVEKA